MNARYDLGKVRSGRENEYRAVCRCTRLLKEASASSLKTIRIDALYQNIRLWTIFLGDLSSVANQLPQELRRNLIEIGLFSVRYSHAAFSQDLKLDPLIDVNSSIMMALRQEG